MENKIKTQLEALIEHLQVTMKSGLKMAETCDNDKIAREMLAEASGINFVLGKIITILEANKA